jgi:hypothetical protein
MLLAYSWQNPPANGKRVTLPEEISQTRKQGKNYTPLTLSSQPSFAFTGRNMFISME